MITTFKRRKKELNKLDKQTLIDKLSITTKIHSMTIQDNKQEIIYAILEDEGVLK